MKVFNAHKRNALALCFALTAASSQAATSPMLGVQLWSVKDEIKQDFEGTLDKLCLLYTSPSPRDATLSRMPSSA